MEQPTSETTWTQWEEEGDGNKKLAAGAILASAVAAGVVAFLLRRSRQKQDEESLRATLIAQAQQRSRVVGDEALVAGREFLMTKVVPELRPVMLTILSDVESAMNQSFRRAEQGIKNL